MARGVVSTPQPPDIINAEPGENYAAGTIVKVDNVIVKVIDESGCGDCYFDDKNCDNTPGCSDQSFELVSKAPRRVTEFPIDDIGDIVEVNGKRYIAAEEDRDGSCDGCAFERSQWGCDSDRPCDTISMGCSRNTACIFKGI